MELDFSAFMSLFVGYLYLCFLGSRGRQSLKETRGLLGCRVPEQLRGLAYSAGSPNPQIWPWCLVASGGAVT